MAALNPSIILAGDKPDYLGSFTRGVSAREVFDKQKSAKAKRNFLKDYGADLYSGDEGALEAYSQHDLEGAMALKGHFDQKKAMAARAAQAGQARQREKELASIQTSMGNVEQLRDWADKQKNPSVAFNNALGGVLKPETVQRFKDAGIDLSYENIETAGMQVANATGTKWSGRASPDPQDAANLQYKQTQTKNLQSQIADRDKVETPLEDVLDKDGNVIAQKDPTTGKVTPIPESMLPKEKVDPKSPLGKLFADFNSGAIPKDQQAGALANALKSNKGLSIRTNPDGTFEIEQGGTGAGGDGAGAKVAPSEAKKLGADYTQVKSVDMEGNEVIRQIPIKGSETWLKATDTLQKQGRALESFKTKNAVMKEDIEKAIEQTSWKTTGMRAMGADNPLNFVAHDLYNTLTTIKANVGFDKLQDIRDNSPTGGALGQVSTFELEQLQSVMGSLVQSQSEEQLDYNLQRLAGIMEGLDAKLEKAYNQDLKDYGVQLGGDTKIPTAKEVGEMSKEEILAIPVGTISQITDQGVLNKILGAYE